MAELSEAARQAVVGAFLFAYNAEHRSRYDLESAEPPVDRSSDYLCVDPSRRREPLKVQLTRAKVEVETVGNTGFEGTTRPIQGWVHHPQARNLPTVGYGTAAVHASRGFAAKAARLGPSTTDLILLIFFDFTRHEDDELEEMRLAVRWAAKRAKATNGGAEFREVWAVSASKHEPAKADCLWSATKDLLTFPPLRQFERAFQWHEALNGVDDYGVSHVVRQRTEAGLCEAYLVPGTPDGAPRCEVCERLLASGMNSRS